MSTSIEKSAEAIPTTAEVAEEIYLRRGEQLMPSCQLVSELFSVDDTDVHGTSFKFRIMAGESRLKPHGRIAGEPANDWHFQCSVEEWCRVLADPATNAKPRDCALRLYRSLQARRLELEELAKQPKPLSELITGMLSSSRADRLAEKKQRLGRLLAVLVTTRDASLVGHIAEAAADLGMTDTAIASRVGYIERALTLEEKFMSFGPDVHEQIRTDYMRQIREKASDLPHCYDRSVSPPMLWRTL